VSAQYHHPVPELPDITVYLDALRPRILNQTLTRISIRSPFLLRTFDPPIESAESRLITDLSRLGKRIVLHLDPDLFLVIHLMIAGRLRWKDAAALPAGTTAKPAAPKPSKIDLASFTFSTGTLTLTEASPKKRASLHLVRGRASLSALDPGGLDIFQCTTAQFTAALRRANHTLKRVLADPRTFSGIGNAYSDEILHAAKLSPIKLSQSLTDEEAARLHHATRATLQRWTDQLRADFGLVNGASGRFPGPGEITAFRPDFAVHGRFGKPCPVCGSPVQRIVYAENETNYCVTCQTSGKVLADRSMSRLLKDDWPRTLEELEGS
jgi:formamidopyrimidine-DNA glycosylase